MAFTYFPYFPCMNNFIFYPWTRPGYSRRWPCAFSNGSLLTSLLAQKLLFLFFPRKVLLKFYLHAVIHFHLFVPPLQLLGKCQKTQSTSYWCWIIFRCSWSVTLCSWMYLSQKEFPHHLNRHQVKLSSLHLSTITLERQCERSKEGEREEKWRSRGVWIAKEKFARFKEIPGSSAINNMCHSWWH